MTRGEVLASPTSTRGVPTTLSRIYYAQFSCSRDVSSSQLVFRVIAAFFFVSYLLLFLLRLSLVICFYVWYADSRGVCARARLASFQCVTRAQCETADVARHGIFFLSVTRVNRKKEARSRRKLSKLPADAWSADRFATRHLLTSKSVFANRSLCDNRTEAAAASYPALIRVTLSSIRYSRGVRAFVHFTCRVVRARKSSISVFPSDTPSPIAGIYIYIYIIFAGVATDRETKEIRKYIF